MDIYTISKGKPHNAFYLNRYIKFINFCAEHNNKKTNQELGYCENHHILPKSKDLFPEYKSFRDYPWNCIKLTTRQHFIAHLLLYKCFGNSQCFAFLAMCKQKAKPQKERYDKINSKIYSKLKEETKNLISQKRKGKSSYKDSNGVLYFCSKDDPRVISGELISISKGRKNKPKTEESKKRIIRSGKSEEQIMFLALFENFIN